MGIEYKFHLSSPDERKLDGILRRGPFFSDYDPEHRLYNFRMASNTDSAVMPDLVAAIVSDGLYVCDKCGSPDVAVQFLDYLKASLEAETEQLRLEEL